MRAGRGGEHVGRRPSRGGEEEKTKRTTYDDCMRNMLVIQYKYVSRNSWASGVVINSRAKRSDAGPRSQPTKAKDKKKKIEKKWEDK